MRRLVVERVLIPALRVLQQPHEQMWLGITLATLLVIVFGPGGNSSVPMNAPGSYHSAANAPPFATTQATVKKAEPHPASRPLNTARLPEETGPTPKDEFGVIH